jgi:hypothetical protein
MEEAQGATSEEGAGTSPVPGEAGATTPEATTTTEDPEKAQAGLREEVRKANARALVAELSLPEGSRELLELVPRDQQEERAKGLAAGIEKRQPTAQAPETPKPEAQEPPNVEALKEGGTEGPPAANPPTSQSSEMEKEIADAIAKGGGTAEFEAIQRKYKGK